MLGAAICGRAGVVWSYTHESPEVRAMIDRAVAFLEKEQRQEYGPGADAIVALALLKAEKDLSHPLIQKGLQRAQKFASEVPKNGVGGACYHASICLIFLCEADHEQYATEINALLTGMLQRQQPNGCWGYESHNYDDTSQSQYGILCLWEAHEHRFLVPAAAVERAANWVMRTQDVSGGWSYVARDPGTAQRQKQQEVTHSMTAAGLGSLYVCAYLMGFSAGAQAEAAEEKAAGSGLPSALERVQKEEDKKKPSRYLRPAATSPQQLAATAAAGNAWFEKNLTYDIKKWTHYYMYGIERYKSFQEKVEGKVVPEPAWYNQGVEFLQKTQNSNGSWKTADAPGADAATDTAFAMLFLTRSSQQALRKSTLEEGTLIAGRGLPKDLTNARMQDGKVVTPQMVREVDDLLDLLKSAEDKDFDATALPGGLTLGQDLTKRTSQLERLRELVTHADFNARLAAVKTLARSHNLDNVPALIHALSDPNPAIVVGARDGLRFISRKFDGFGMPDRPTEQQVQAAQTKWKEWFRSIRPGAEFIE